MVLIEISLWIRNRTKRYFTIIR